MTKLMCFKCQRVIQVDGTKGFGYHLRAFHAVGSSGDKLVCGQSGCMQTFYLMNSFLKHIRVKHMPIPRDANVVEPEYDIPGCDDIHMEEAGEMHPHLILKMNMLIHSQPTKLRTLIRTH